MKGYTRFLGVTGMLCLLSHWAFAFVSPSRLVSALTLLVMSLFLYNCHKLRVPNLATGCGQGDHKKKLVISEIRADIF